MPEISLQTFAPGEGSTFLHAHKTHEELYSIVSGKGEFQVDGKTFAVAQGSVVGGRTWKSDQYGLLHVRTYGTCLSCK